MYDLVQKEAAQKRSDIEISYQEKKEKRTQELRELAKEADYFLDRRRGRRQKGLI